jgi:hypothetical protein
MAPGSGAGINWIFTNGEGNVLNRANCRRFADLSKKLM